MAKQTTLASAAKQAAFTAPLAAAQDLSFDDHADSYIQGVGVPMTHPAHDPAQPGKMPYEYAINVVPSAIT